MCGVVETGAEASELREAGVVEHDQHHVRCARPRVAAARSRRVSTASGVRPVHGRGWAVMARTLPTDEGPVAERRRARHYTRRLRFARRNVPVTLVQAPTKNQRLVRWIDEMAAALPTRHGALVRRFRRRVRDRSAGSSSTPAPSWRSTLNADRAPTGRGPIPKTSHASRTARSSAPSARSTPGPRTTGRTPPRCGRRSTSCSGVPCAAARCTSCRSAWDHSARRCRTSASRSPIRPTSR